ncbi:MAG: hypothetical protein FWF79_06135 [Defluviitaleaceae bacterium]|nr:hypothetical protein [Defluviitaleaceae bacterium]
MEHEVTVPEYTLDSKGKKEGKMSVLADIKVNNDFLLAAIRNDRNVTDEEFNELMKFSNDDSMLTDVMARIPLVGN